MVINEGGGMILLYISRSECAGAVLQRPLE